MSPGCCARCCYKQGLARGKVLDKYTLTSIAREASRTPVIGALSRESLVRLMWAFASPGSVEGERHASQWQQEIRDAFAKAGKAFDENSIHTPIYQRVDYGDRKNEYFYGEATVKAALDCIVGRVGELKAKDPNTFTREQRVILAWSLATMGIRNDELFHAAFPPLTNTDFWDGMSKYVSNTRCCAMSEG